MGEVRVNVTNFVAVGAMGFVGVWLLNRLMRKMGKPQLAA